MSALFNDVVIRKQSGGLGRRTPDQDMVSGLLFDGVETNELKYGELKRISSVADAEALGIDADYDIASKGQSAYYQISQFFRMNPSGDLYLMVVENPAATPITYAELAANAKAMQEAANGAIRQIAIIFSDASANFAATSAAVQTAQTQAKEAFEAYMPFEAVVEGKGFNPADALDLSSLNSENVSVVIAMDPAQAAKDGTDDAQGNASPDYSNSAAVGTLLGAVSAAKVSENVAWVEKFNLAGEGFGSVGFIGGQQVSDLKTLDEYKYIFTRTHTGLSGVYFNDSHTCTERTSDFTYIESNRTINKASRLIRTALLPKLNSPVLVDPEEGTLPPSVVKGFETLCRATLERMVANGEASEIDVYVNPLQDILATSTLDIKVEVVPMGTARRIVVDLGFKNPFGINLA